MTLLQLGALALAVQMEAAVNHNGCANVDSFAHWSEFASEWIELHFGQAKTIFCNLDEDIVFVIFAHDSGRRDRKLLNEESIEP